jgi:hypothetical protein
VARQLVRASSQYLERTSAVLAAYPITWACWASFTDVTTVLAHSLMSMSLAGGSKLELFDFIANGASSLLRIYSDDGTTSVSATMSAVPAINTWHHYAGVIQTASRQPFYDGTPGTAVTTSLAIPAGMNRTSIGRYADYAGSGGANYLGGSIAAAGIWNVALTAAEIASLAAGLHPSLVRPEALVAVYDLLDSDGDIDKWGQNNLTATNSPTYASHPPIIYPDGIQVVSKAPAAPATGNRRRRLLMRQA